MGKLGYALLCMALAIVALQRTHAQGLPQARFAEPVTITPAQADLLRAEAQRLTGRVNEADQQMRSLEADRAFGTLKTVFMSRASAEIGAVSQARTAFTNLSQSDSQRQAAQVFFGDFITRYNAVSNRFTTLENVDYPVIRDNAVRVFDDNKLAYGLAAANQSLTFNLAVRSTPAGAAVSYRRTGDQYQDHNDPTNTRLANLVYAIWNVRARLGSQVQEKPHNPYQEADHVVSFDFTKP